MTYDSRLFRAPRLRKIVEMTDDIAECCGLIADALSEYEQADEDDDPGESRENARQDAWEQLGELLDTADRLRAERDQLDATLDATDAEARA